MLQLTSSGLCCDLYREGELREVASDLIFAVRSTLLIKRTVRNNVKHRNLIYIVMIVKDDHKINTISYVFRYV